MAIKTNINLRVEYNKINSNDFHVVYSKFNKTFLQLLTKEINHDNFLLGDFGGGSGILAMELTEILQKKGFKNFHIDIIDIDPIKPKSDRIITIKNNVLTYLAKDKYSFSLCRFLLHNFNEDEQLTLLKNINYNTKKDGYFLLISFVLDDEQDYKIKRKILDYIENKIKISKRSIPTSEKIKELCNKAGFQIVNEIKKDYDISIEDFYKNRFNLNKHEVRELLDNIKRNDHNESQLALLLKKVS